MDKQRMLKLFDAVLIHADKIGYTDAFIAGGAVRDMLHGYEPKDIDVFTWQSIPEDHLMFPGDGSSGEPSDPRVAGVSKNLFAEAVSPYPIELIQLNEPEQRVDKRTHWGKIQFAVADFAVGLDQVWYDGHSVGRTKDYVKDTRGHTFTITRAENELEARRSAAKINRLWERGYYHDWRMVLPHAYFSKFFTPAYLAGAQHQEAE